MSFDRALGDVKVAGDLGIVATLEQEIDDLLLAGTDGSQSLLHWTAPRKSRAGSRKWRKRWVRTQRKLKSVAHIGACAQPFGRVRVKKV